MRQSGGRGWLKEPGIRSLELEVGEAYADQGMKTLHIQDANFLLINMETKDNTK